MNNKHFKVLLIIVSLCLFTFIGCAANDDSPSLKYDISPDEYITAENFVIDNDTPLCTLLTNEYALSDLTSFFGDPVCLGDLFFETEHGYRSHTWDEVNSRFPVQCLRYHRNVHYAVYKVVNGGYFYVFWYVPLVSSNTHIPNQEEDIITVSNVYIDELCTSFSFVPIIKGLSTASDVVKIDPRMELNLLSSITCSYSLLRDGRIYKIVYSHDTVESLDDLVVKEIMICSKDSVPAKLAAIFSTDLPEDEGQGDGSVS